MWNVGGCVNSGLESALIGIVTEKLPSIEAEVAKLNIKFVSDVDGVRNKRPYYNFIKCHIGLDEAFAYDNVSSYYDVVFHEIGHWAGDHFQTPYGVVNKKQDIVWICLEECSAQLTSSLLLDHFGLQTDETADITCDYINNFSSLAATREYELRGIETTKDHYIALAIGEARLRFNKIRGILCS